MNLNEQDRESRIQKSPPHVILSEAKDLSKLADQPVTSDPSLHSG